VPFCINMLFLASMKYHVCVVNVHTSFIKTNLSLSILGL
jgi:hypothetical protein